MRVLEVYLNGKKLCVAGWAEGSSVTASVSSVLDENFNECFCYVAGSVGPDGDFAKWVDQEPLGVGDEIIVRISECEAADKPVSVKKAQSPE